ncbi:MAG TPA: hypothetical protein VHX61_06410 [Rhizomicrobium sp.]|jgi:hypothetical protein|nr:hypothetical protein [Rhizomicrobium sp.]
MQDSALQAIHGLQQRDLPSANGQLMRFLVEELELPFRIDSVELRPGAVSLNSINGVLHTDRGRKFFKTHVEPASIVTEYYNVGLLRDAGYPIIAPAFASTAYGRQILIYDYIEAPSLFDAIRKIDTGAADDCGDLASAVRTSDDLLFHLYGRSLRFASAESHARQPVHQLFLHRLSGRYSNFYGGEFTLPEIRIDFPALARKKWIINGIAYRDSLEALVTKARETLGFRGVPQIPAITGHGDAHSGNQLYFGRQAPLTYFDPAFAGTHSPMLDLIKPLIHNSFLKWLYFPDEVAAANAISCRMTDDTVTVEYDFRPSEIRIALFESKLTRVIAPMLELMEEQKLLPDDWQAVMQAAAMCCPLLTMNLADRRRFKPETALLGLAMAVELGARSQDARHPGWFEERLKDVVPPGKNKP